MGYLMMALCIYAYGLLMTYDLKRKKKFTGRSLGVLALVLLTFVPAVIVNQRFFDGMYPFMLYLWGVTSVGIAFCYEERKIMYVYWGLTAMATFGVAESWIQVAHYYMRLPVCGFWFLEWGLRIVVGILVYLLMKCYSRRKRRGNNHGAQSFFLLVVVLLLSMFLMLEKTDHHAISPGGYLVFYAEMSLMGLLLLYIFYAENILSSRNQELSDMLEKDRIRYEISKEYTDMINMKCHDLKHQIHYLERQEPVDNEYVRELKKAIEIYDSDICTGNEALDIVLAEKKRACVDKNIAATFMADGKSLDFMKKYDVYSLFGNILDNAMEAVEKLPQKERRQISLVIMNEAGVVRIREENFYDGRQVTDAKGMLISTKADTINHGFGTKSISYIVEKYGGVMHLDMQDAIFTMNIVFAMEEKEKCE